MSHRHIITAFDIAHFKRKIIFRPKPILTKTLHLLILAALIASSLVGLIEPATAKAVEMPA